MTAEEFIRLIISFIGGGAVAGILNWVFFAKSASKERKIENSIQQLNHLYAPLIFFVSQNDDMFKLNSKFHTAYKAENTQVINGVKTKIRKRVLRIKPPVSLISQIIMLVLSKKIMKIS